MSDQKQQVLGNLQNNPTQKAEPKDDQKIVGDEWKLDLSAEDRDLANEVEGKLKEVQKQMDMIEQKQKSLKNRMSFPFGLGQQSGLPNLEEIAAQQKQQQSQSGQSIDQVFPQPPKIDAKDFPVIDSRGNLITSTDMAIENYHKSPPFIRCLQLPFCYTQIKSKIQFWGISSIGLSMIYHSFQLVRDRISLKQLQFKPIMKKAGLVFLVGSVFSTLETIFFDDYCDINSYHYQDSNRTETIQYLKQRILASQRKK